MSADQIAEFQAGVTAVLRMWSPFRAAVDNQWGGIESHAKANDLRSSIFENFDLSQTKQRMDPTDLEDDLVIYLEEEFSIGLEDGSEKQVAAIICELYDSCAKGDISLARSMVERALKIQPAAKVVVQAGGEMEDSDDDDDDGMECEESSALPAIGTSVVSQDAATYAAGSLFGPDPLALSASSAPAAPSRQLGAPREMEAVPEVDDDGFAAVPVRRSRRENKGERPGVNC
uniref:Pre-rRNA-processing protein TSR2 homolog n=1 Tax=Proboscia inermis TaxID=420281 RepID=A0A7S0CMB6_9STRA